MKLPAQRFVRGSGTVRFAAVWVEPGSSAGTWMVYVSRGMSAATAIAQGWGPLDSSAASTRYYAELETLGTEGFEPSGRAARRERLSSPDPSVRARAAVAAGWRRETSLVDAVVAAAQQGGTDLPTLVEALGRMGDARGCVLARDLSAKKLLSRRRAGIEALRLLGDQEELAQALEACVERLPPAIAKARGEGAQALLDVVATLDSPRRALVAEQLYELGDDASLVRSLWRDLDVARPHHFRYAKSIFKRAMLRDDFATFAFLVHRFDRAARESKGATASLKSGLDGATRSTPVFRLATQRWIQRAGARYLRRLAAHRSHEYAACATEVLLAYGPEDCSARPGVPFSDSLVVHRILFGASPRYRTDRRGQIRLGASTSQGEGALAVHLWTRETLLQLLIRARLLEAQEFALRRLAPHEGMFADLSTVDLARALGSTHPRVRDLATTEVRRRFRPDAPDLALLDALVGATDAGAAAVGCELARDALGAGALPLGSIARLLATPHLSVRTSAVEFLIRGVCARPELERRALAEMCLAHVRAGGSIEHVAPFADLLVRGLAAELLSIVSTTEALSLLEGTDPNALRVAATVLAVRAGALELAGLDRVRQLARSEVVAVRVAAVALLDQTDGSSDGAWRVAGELAESPWDDVRAPTLRWVTRALPTALAERAQDRARLDAFILGWVDSSHPDARRVGQQAVRWALAQGNSTALLARIAEHPSQDVRDFVLPLLVQALPEGIEGLRSADALFVAMFSPVSASRATRAQALDFLAARGLVDEAQAGYVASLLGPQVRTRSVRDFERIVSALAAIQARYPKVSSPLRTGAA